MKNFESRLTNKVFQAICLAQIPQFNKLEPGQYLERVATIPELKSFFGGEVVRASINAMVSVITIVIISLINAGAGLTLIAASILLWVASLSISSRKVTALREKSEIEGLTNSKIIEIVSRPLDNKSRTMEYRLESLMTEMIRTRENKNIAYENLESQFNLTLTLIQQLSIAVVVVLLAISVIELEASQGVMAAIIMLTNRYFGPYQQMMRTLGRWKTNKMQITDIAEILSLQHHSSDNSKNVDVSPHTVQNNARMTDGDNPNELNSEQHQPGHISQSLNLPNNPDPKSIEVELGSNQRIIFQKGQPIILKGRSGTGKVI